MQALPVEAQAYKDAQCSFWYKGNALGTSPCRTSWKNGKIYSVNYLAEEVKGKGGTQETETVWQNDWIPGNLAECMVLKTTNYAICEK